MKASTSKENEIFAKELEDELMKYATNDEEKKVGANLVEQTQKIHKNTYMRVNIMECSKSRANELAEAECSDTTECSTSFDDSDNGAEGADTLSDSEALSNFHGDAESALDFDGFGKLSRTRKKLSSHWRSFIHPITWRCKWAELQIKKLEAQAQKYDRKLEEYNQKKQVQLGKSTWEGLDIKSLSLSQNYVRGEVLRRKKRRRAEATNDIGTYMSHHNLFSYYENRKNIREVAYHVLKNPDAPQEVKIDDESWGTDELLCVETESDDNFLEDVLWKIELLRSQVDKLKTRVDKMMGEQAGKFSFTDNLSSTVLHNASMSSPPNAAAPPSTGYPMPVGTYIASQLMSDYNMGGVLLPESAVASGVEVAPDANGCRYHAHFVYAYGNEDDEVLIDNQRVREEMRYFEEVKIHSIQRPSVLKDGLASTSRPVLVEPDLLTNDQPPPKMHSIYGLPKSTVLAEADLLTDDQPLPKVQSISSLHAVPKSTVPAEPDLLTDDQPPPPPPPPQTCSNSNLKAAPKSKRGRRKGAAP